MLQRFPCPATRKRTFYTWWRHQMETFSALLAICAGNSPVPGEFPAQRPVTRSFDVFFDLRLNKRLSKQSWGRWFETLSCPLWRHFNGISIDYANDPSLHWFVVVILSVLNRFMWTIYTLLGGLLHCHVDYIYDYTCKPDIILQIIRNSECKWYKWAHYNTSNPFFEKNVHGQKHPRGWINAKAVFAYYCIPMVVIFIIDCDMVQRFPCPATQKSIFCITMTS